MALTDKLSAIGDAIREKTGGTDKLTLDEMVTEIGSIEGGEIIEVPVVDYTIEDWLLTGNDKFRKVYINDRVKVIDQYAGRLADAGYLSFPNTTTILGNAFTNNQRTYKLNLPELNTLSIQPFNNMTGLRIIKAPKLTSLPSTAFNGDYNLLYIDLPNLNTISGNNAFSTCSKITCVNLPKLTYTDATDVFSGASSLEYISLNCPLVSRMFYNNKALRTVKVTTTWPSTKTFYPNTVFYGCSNITTVILDVDIVVTTSQPFNSIFDNCYFYVPSALLEEYKVATNWSAIADKIRAIEDYPNICDVPIGCYYDEEATTVSLANPNDMNSGYITLTGIVAPKATKVNGRAASNLVYVDAPLCDTVYGSDFLYCSKLQFLNLPSLDCVYQDAFNGCTRLRKVEFTADKKAIIYANAFRNCSALKTVILRHEGAVATISGAHEGANSALTYYVPSSLLASYQETYPDYTFATIEDHPEIEYAELNL